jgi:hypothetical protein
MLLPERSCGKLSKRENVTAKRDCSHQSETTRRKPDTLQDQERIIRIKSTFILFATEFAFDPANYFVEHNRWFLKVNR